MPFRRCCLPIIWSYQNSLLCDLQGARSGADKRGKPALAVIEELETRRFNVPLAELNERLSTLTRDTATLRRGFIDYRMMTRDVAGTAYAKAG